MPEARNSLLNNAVEILPTRLRSVFATNVASSYATRLGIMVIGLANTVIVSRWLGPEGRGIYAVAVAVATVAVQFGNFGMQASSCFQVAKQPELLPRLLGNAGVIAAVCGGGAALVTCAALIAYPRVAHLPQTELLLALVWIPIGIAYLLLQNLLLGIHEIGAYNRIEFGSKLFGVICLVGLIGLGLVSVPSFVAASLAVFAVGLVSAFHRLNSIANERLRPSLTLIKSGYRIGLRAYGVMFLSFLVLRIDLLMVNSLLGAAQAGYYSIAATMADYVAMLPAVVASLLFPKLVSTVDPQHRKLLATKITIATATVLLPTVVAAALLTRPVVKVLFGAAYMPAASAFVWLMPGMFFLGIETVVVQLINSYGYPAILLYVWAVCCALNIGLNLWAIPVFGITGASMVSSVCYTLICALVLLALRFSRLKETAPVPQAVTA